MTSKSILGVFFFTCCENVGQTLSGPLPISGLLGRLPHLFRLSPFRSIKLEIESTRISQMISLR